MARNQWQRLGYAAVNFGRPVSILAYCRERELDFRRMSTEQRNAEIERFARHLMSSIAQLIPALPVPIAASTLLRADSAGLSEADWKEQFYQMADELRARGVNVVVPPHTREHTFETAKRMLQLRRLVVGEGDSYRPAIGSEEVLRYYVNSLAGVPATDRASSS
jgi:glycerol-3-phosphate O-acyltransferase